VQVSGLCHVHAGSPRQSLPESHKNPCPARQPVDPQPRRPLQGFPRREARRVLKRLAFHFTPKHASWLNMVEIEIGVLRGNASTGGSKSVTSSSPKLPQKSN